MTKHKILTSEAKIHSKLSKKLNNCKEFLNDSLRGIERRNKQIKIDYQFKKILRDKYPETYWKVVEEINKKELE